MYYIIIRVRHTEDYINGLHNVTLILLSIYRQNTSEGRATFNLFAFLLMIL